MEQLKAREVAQATLFKDRFEMGKSVETGLAVIGAGPAVPHAAKGEVFLNVLQQGFVQPELSGNCCVL